MTQVRIPYLAYGHTSTLAPTLLERRMGRLMRASAPPNDFGGGPDSTAGDNNGSGNDGQQSQQSTNQNNNTGSAFNPSTFWGESGDGTNGSPRGGESAESKAPPSGSQQGNQQQQQPANPAQGLMTDLQNLKFTAPIMTEQTIKDLGEGKTESFHAAMNGFGQQVAQQTLRMTVGLMAQVRDQMYERMREEFGSTLTQRDNQSDLLKAIPSAADPKVKPVVDSIFNRALQISKGDRAAAIDMTKQMMRLQFETMGDDLGIPPRSPNDSFNPGGTKTDWLAELAGR